MPSLTNILLLGVAALAATVFGAPIEEQFTPKFWGPAGGKKFKLMVLPASTSDAWEGMWVSTFHTGAGEAVTVLTYNQTASPIWHFHEKTGDIHITVPNGNGPSFPESIGFSDNDPYMSSAPPGYKLVTVNDGYPKSGFNFGSNVTTANVAFNPKPFGLMAACYVNGTAPYFSAGSQIQMFWHPLNVSAPDYHLCADVLLKAVESF